MLNRFKAKEVPILSFSRFIKGRTYIQNGKTWDGETGRVMMKLQLYVPSEGARYVIITADGLLISYSALHYNTPNTAYFMTPSTFIKILKYANRMPDTVPIEIIYQTLYNCTEIVHYEAAAKFSQMSGTRRYIP